MSFRLPTTEEKADYILNQFNRIAKHYDLANDVISLGMHRLWKREAIKALQLKPDGRYLDVCCGTGDLTLRIADFLSSAGSVVGVDFSSSMLQVAQLRLNNYQFALNSINNSSSVRLEPGYIRFVQGDALNLPFPTGHFDGAVISFGLRNLTDLGRGLSQMARVVKPGGKIVNLDLGHPTNPVFKPIYYYYFYNIVPLIGQFLQNEKNAYTYLPESLNTYPPPVGITQLFQAIGLKETKHIPLALGSVALHVGTC